MERLKENHLCDLVHNLGHTHVNLNLEFKRELIRAFFDDEGSVRSDNHTVRFHQDNKELLEKIRSLIIEFDINPHGILSYVRRDKERCYFNICGFKEYVKFFSNYWMHFIKQKEGI